MTQNLRWPTDVHTQPSPSLHVDAASSNDVLTISLSGDLDIAAEPALRDMLSQILASHLPIRVIIDLAQLEFCDCAGVRVLVDTCDIAAGYGATCTLENPQPHVRWLLQAMDVTATLGLR